MSRDKRKHETKKCKKSEVDCGGVQGGFRTAPGLNLFKYDDGDAAVCRLPDGMHREPAGMYGVNVYVP